MAVGSRIGHLNVVKGLDQLTLAEHSTLGRLNWVSGLPLDSGSGHFSLESHRVPSLVLGEHSAVTSRHLLDYNAAVEIGRYATVAGSRSQILSHTISIAHSRQTSAPVRIGHYCFVGTGCIVLPGVELPSYSVLGAGSVLNKTYSEEFTFYAGSPARPIRAIDRSSDYFHREIGFVVWCPESDIRSQY